MSQTQLSNINTFAGLVFLILQQFNILIPKENLAFIIGAVWTTGWTAYNYYNRYKKGDLTLLGRLK